MLFSGDQRQATCVVFSFFSSQACIIDGLLEQHGLCRALSYIIQTLSADPAFGNQLSLPVKIQIPTKWVPQGTLHGTAADFMITVSDQVASFISGINSIIVNILHYRNYFRLSQFDIPGAYYCAGECGSIFQELVRCRI